MKKGERKTSGDRKEERRGDRTDRRTRKATIQTKKIGDGRP